jgi:hypothetical protein
MKEIKVRYMVDGFHILTLNRTKKPLAIVLSGVGRGLSAETRQRN